MAGNQNQKKSGGGIWRNLWLAIALAALFAAGITTGIYWNHGKSAVRQVGMSDSTCMDIERRISSMIDIIYHNNDSRYTELVAEQVKSLRELNGIYSQNCKDKQIKPTENIKPKEAGQAPKKLPEKTCEEIEVLLLDRVVSDEPNYSDNRKRNAEVYVMLSDKGCPENKEKYEQLALRELEIYRALTNDGVYAGKSWEEYQREVVSIYNKIDMKKEAEKFLDKMKKLTDPAIDFILEAERVFSE
ncbi:MAG: hypothetical protein LBD50_03855 [Rickettsiales bacterium]|jgi:hypothetical protein|nr:hypothetical protein [Rickettsiales bacterium]